MSTVKRLQIMGASAVALSLLATSAWATVPTGASTVPTYATQAVPASGAVTLPTTLNVSFTNTFATCPAGGTVTYQFTLPSGVTFTTNPTATASGGAFTGIALTASAGGAPTGNISFTAACAAAGGAGPGTITLSQFSVAGATALQSNTLSSTATTAATGSSNGFAISAQITSLTGATGVAVGDKASTGLANAANGLTYASAGAAIGAPVIDSTSPSLARQFQQPLGSPDTLIADLGNVTVSTTPGLINANGLAFTFGGTPATITVTGNFLGITSAYLQKGGTTVCGATTATPSTAIPGVITTASTITFSADPTDTGAQEVCLVANGTSLLSASGTLGTTAKVGSNASVIIAASALSAYTYTGAAPFQITYTGGNGSYLNFIRVVNNNTSAANVFAIVQADGGAIGTATVETALAANSNDLVPASTIVSNAGVNPGASGRVSMILVSSSTNVAFANLLLNPNGTLVTIP